MKSRDDWRRAFRTPQDYDDDRRWTNPRAWRRLKETMGRHHRLDVLLAMLERIARRVEAKLEGRPGDNCPRLQLAVALHAYAAAGAEARTGMRAAFNDWATRQNRYELACIGHRYDGGAAPTPPPPLVLPPPPPLPESLPDGEKASQADVDAFVRKLWGDEGRAAA